MSRVARLCIFAVLVAGCGSTTPLPPSEPILDAGVDAGSDAGQAFIAMCTDAGCGTNLDKCEAFHDGGVACEHICGNSCLAQNFCNASRCHDLDAGRWVDAWCTNVPSRMWAETSACDDGNQCTGNDACTLDAGCVGTPSSTSTPCDAGNVCLSADHCDGTGGCTGTAVHDDQERFADSVVATYAWASPGTWNFTGWADDGVAYSSVPGGKTIHMLFDQLQIDRVLSFQTVDGTYTNMYGTLAGTGLDAQAPGARELQVSVFRCVDANGTDCGDAGPNATRHYFFLSGHGSAPAGTPSGSGIWVCPP